MKAIATAPTRNSSNSNDTTAFHAQFRTDPSLALQLVENKTQEILMVVKVIVINNILIF